MAKKPLNLAGTPSLKALLAEAERLGFEVATVNRTGEVRVRRGDTVVTINNRRTDGPKVLIVILRRAQKEEQGD